MVNKVTYKSLFIQLLLISILGYGGGAAVIPLFHKAFVEEKKWFTEADFQNILTVSNTLPGPIQTKIAGYIGFKTKGFLGLFLSVLTIITPGLLLMMLFFETIQRFQHEPWVNGAISGIYPVVTIMMGLLVYTFAKRGFISLKPHMFILLVFIYGIAFFVLDIHPAWIILLTIITSFLYRYKAYIRLSILGSLIILIYVLQQLISLHINPSFTIDMSMVSELFQLIIAFLIPGIFGYGGGPGSLSLISYEVVDRFALITTSEFGLAVAIQSALPGVTAAKLAGSIGFQVLGYQGLIMSILSYIIPSLLLMVVFLQVLNKNKNHPVVILMVRMLSPIVMLLLLRLVINFFNLSLSNLGIFISVLFMISAFLMIKVLRVHPFFVIILYMLLGGVISL